MTPTWAVPVDVKRPPDGTDAEVVVKAEQNGRFATGGRLVCLVKWIDEARIAQATGTWPKPAKNCPQAREARK